METPGNGGGTEPIGVSAAGAFIDFKSSTGAWKNVQAVMEQSASAPVIIVNFMVGNSLHSESQP